MSDRLKLIAWITPMVWGLGTGVPCAADMVVQQGGKVRVGRVISESGADIIRLETGTASSPSEVKIPREKVKEVVRGEGEIARIGACGDVGRLEAWTAGYFQAGLKDFACRCVERALDLDRAVGAAPKKRSAKAKKPKRGAETFHSFWNRAVLRRRVAGLKKRDASGQLATARWAHAAGLKDEARRTLRRAWNLDRRSTEIPELAADWQVPLGPWIRLDLTAAMQTPLLTDTITDEGTVVMTRPGMVFLTLPLRYDSRAGPKTLSKSSFRGRDFRGGYYGLRSPQGRGAGAKLLAPSNQEPVYERWELEPGGEAGRTGSKKRSGGSKRSIVTAKNTHGPRRVEGGETVRDRPKDRVRSFRPSGWAALVVEVPDDAKRVTFQWVDRGSGLHDVEEALDLSFLRHVGDPLSAMLEGGGRRRGSRPRAVEAMLGKLRGDSSATAALAITRLALLREEAQGMDIGPKPGAPPAWMAGVDEAVVIAGVRPEEDVRSAAWAYFVSQPSVAWPAIDFLSRQSDRIHHEWIALIAAGLAELGPEGASPAAEMLGGILRSDNASVCNGALDLLMGLGADVDWWFAEHASETSQSLALARLDRITDPSSARRLLLTLMRNVRPNTADQIAHYAARWNVGMASPDNTVLAQWSAAETTADRVALLNVLGSMPLGDLLHSRRVAAIIEEATADDAEEAVRRAAFDALIQQGRFRLERTGAGGGRSRDRGSFPVFVSTAARDPLVRGLAKAATSEAGRGEVGALEVMLLLGYAEEAARCVTQGAKDAAARASLLEKLVTSNDRLARSDGLLCMLGHMLRREHASSAGFILSHLSRVWAEAPTSQQWRLLASIRAGVDFEELSRLGMTLTPPRVGGAMRWLNKLSHTTAQDRQRLTASHDVEEYIERLGQVDSRRAYLVDGRYGALAIVETVVGQGWPDRPNSPESWEGRYRWSVPERITVVLPILRLASSEADNTYEVIWEPVDPGDASGTGEKRAEVLGHGTLLLDHDRLLSPSMYSPRLTDAEESWQSASGWGWPDPDMPGKTLEPAVGPVVLPNRGVSSGSAPGTLTVDVGRYLLAAIREEAAFGKEDLTDLVPEPYQITLRYAAFGSFYGVGQRRELPSRDMSVGRRRLLNVMIVLERID